MLESSLSDYSDAYFFVKGTITSIKRGENQVARLADERDKDVIFKNCTPSTDCISITNNIQSTQYKKLGCFEADI